LKCNAADGLFTKSSKFIPQRDWQEKPESWALGDLMGKENAKSFLSPVARGKNHPVSQGAMAHASV
jgi:hypothetical protein